MDAPRKNNPWIFVTFILAAYVVLSQFYDIGIVPRTTGSDTEAVVVEANLNNPTAAAQPAGVDVSSLRARVIPADGVELPIKWGALGRQMVQSGVIDEAKFSQLFSGNLTEEQEKMLSGTWDDKVVLTEANSRFWLDLLWAFGLGNKNDVLKKGEMVSPQYGGAGNFASTGGWSLAKGEAMDHYSKHQLVKLTAEQQKLVEEVSKGIYRPCCGNSTHFPDCNHGLAMLGLLELMAANGVTKDEMYRVALGVNSLWFPQTYIDLATYFQEQGQDWSAVDPATVLGQAYSSAQGYKATRSKIQSLPKVQSSGGGCGA